MKETIQIKLDETGQRIDSFLAKKYPEYSRSYFSALISDKKVIVGNCNVKPSYTVKESDVVEIEFAEKGMGTKIQPENIPINIIFENDDVIVLNKQAGIVVHPAAGNLTGTLVNALLNHFPAIQDAVYDKESEISRIRPGLVHRLDKDTSGVLIVAKNARSMHSLSKQIQNRSVKKTYVALCFSWPKKPSGELIGHLGRHPKNRKAIAEIGPQKGKEAISNFKVRQHFSDGKNRYSLIEFDIKTGRTHQIRVQAANMNNPVMGDAIYGNKSSIELSKRLGIKRQLLHAEKLTIALPGDAKKSDFVAPIPTDLETVLRKLNKFVIR